MQQNFRQIVIFDLAWHKGEVPVRALAERFNVTIQMVRRDPTLAPSAIRAHCAGWSTAIEVGA